MGYMDENFDAEAGDIEQRIEGEFMTKLQDSSVSFDIVETIEGQLGEDDFGGEDEIVKAVEEAVLDDGY